MKSQVKFQIVLLVCVFWPVFAVCAMGGNDGGVAHDGGMVGCEIVNEASNGTTLVRGAGMDRLDQPRPCSPSETSSYL